MGTCQYCNKTARTVSKVIGFCADCIRAHFEEVWPKIKAVLESGFVKWRIDVKSNFQVL